MRAHYLFLACLALLAGSARGADDAAPEAAAAPAASQSSGGSGAAAAAVIDEPKEAEMLDVAESSNNNTAAADEGDGAGASRSNTKRTIDHSLGYGYRYNTVLRPVHVPAGHHHHHYLRRPMQPVPMYKLQQRYPHHFFSSSASSGSGGSASGAGGSSAPFRYSQPLPMPPQREEPQPQPPMMHHGEPMAPMAPRPVTEAPSGPGPHSESISLYRAQPQPEQHPFAFEDDLPKAKQQQQQSELEAQGDAQPVQYADEAPASAPGPSAHSYQQVLQAEPTYILTTSAAAASPSAAGHMFASSSPLAAMYGHAMAHAGHPVMYATAGGQHAAATQMIPVIIVRLMDSQTAAATLSPTATLAHAISPLGHAMGHAMSHHAMPYPLISMQYLRDYLSKLYAPAAPAPAQPQYVTASEPDPLLYSSQLFGSTQLQKLQLQQQLHAQLQKQLQMQVQQQQQQQRPSQSVAEILQEQHRQRVAAAQAQQGRTEVTVHRSPAMSPQDYKESVEQQEEA